MEWEQGKDGQNGSRARGVGNGSAGGIIELDRFASGLGGALEASRSKLASYSGSFVFSFIVITGFLVFIGEFLWSCSQCLSGLPHTSLLCIEHTCSAYNKSAVEVYRYRASESSLGIC